MSATPRTLGQVFDGLASEGLVGDDWVTEALSEADLRTPQPWYVRWLVGFGVWLGSLFLLGAIAAASFVASAESALLLGLVFMGAALVTWRRTSSDLAAQAALATSLTGQVLFAAGVAGQASGDEIRVFFGALLAANVILLVLFEDRTHRFLSVLFVVASAVTLLYLNELQAALPLVGPALAWGSLHLARAEPELVARGQGDAVAPVRTALLVGALGCVMLSTFYLVPGLASDDFAFYPRPWISTLAFGALLLHAERDVWTVVSGSPSSRAALVAYGATVAVVAASLSAPGIVLACLVMSIGLIQGDRFTVGLGIAFLVVFTGAYFYGVETSMLVKSTTLVGTGLALLAAREVLVPQPHADHGGGPPTRRAEKGGVRERVTWAVLGLVLVVANAAIVSKQRIVSGGRTVLVELAPVDPRSLIQGDYVALRYRLSEQVSRAREQQTSADGRVVVRVDERGVATFVRFDDGSALGRDEVLLRYRKRGEDVRVASDAFFFEEGTADVYDDARYGELRVAPSGVAVLVGLRDDQLRVLGATR